MEVSAPPVGRALQQEWKEVLQEIWESILCKVRSVPSLLDLLRKERVLTEGSYSRLKATMPIEGEQMDALWSSALLAAMPPDRRGFEGLKRSLHSLGDTDALAFLFSQWAYETVRQSPAASPVVDPSTGKEAPFVTLQDLVPRPCTGWLTVGEHAV